MEENKEVSVKCDIVYVTPFNGKSVIMTLETEYGETLRIEQECSEEEANGIVCMEKAGRPIFIKRVVEEKPVLN